jgi:putative transposase
LGILLERKGHHVNHKKLFRVYREAGLSVKRTRRKKLIREGVSTPVLSAPNQEWSLDFVHDALATGQAVRVLSVVDTFSRECLALETDTSFASERVTRILDAVMEQRGCPQACVWTTG